MDDLIRRQDAISVLNGKCKRAFNLTCGEEACECAEYMALRDLPPVDAVEVVRCKDCKHKHLENMVWTCPFGLPAGENFFCGYAERRTDE